MKQISLLVMASMLSVLSSMAMHLKTYDITDGLPSSTVKCFCQDQFGFMWMGTFDGLCRFDGTEFLTYRHRDTDTLSLWHNHIESMLVTGDSLWLGTDEGLDRLDIATGQFRHYYTDDGGKIGRLTKLVKIGDLLYALNAGRRLYQIQKGDEAMSLVKAFDESPVHDIIAWGTDRLLVCTTSALVLLNPKNGKCKQMCSLSFPNGVIVRMTYEPQGRNLLVACGFGFESRCYAIDQHLRAVPRDVPLPRDAKAICLFDGKIYWGTDGHGLVEQDPTTLTCTPIHTPLLKSQAIHSLFADKENNLWLGCYRGGMALYSPRYEWFRGLPEGIEPGIVTALINQGDELILGLDGSGLMTYNQQTGASHHYTTANSNLMGDNILSMSADGSLIWMAIYGKGISSYDTRTHQIVNYPLESSCAWIWMICDDGKGRLWVCSNKPVIFDKQTKTATPIPSLEGQNVTQYVFDGPSVWVATMKHGLRKLRMQDFQEERHIHNGTDSRPQLPSNIIRHIHQARDGKIWVAFDQPGLYVIDSKKDEIYPVPTFADMVVVNVLEERSGVFWVSTQNGLVRYEEGTQQAMAYDKNDNLSCTQFCYNACCLCPEGLYLGTTEGPMWFRPESILRKSQPKSLYLVDFEVLGGKSKHLSWLNPTARNIELSHDENFFILRFSSPEYVSPKKLRYACYLEPFEKDWQEHGNNHEVRYTNVPPGTYTLHMRVTNQEWQGGNEETTFQITIRRPWWFRWWAWMLWVSLTVGAAFFAWHLFRTFKLLRQKLVTLRERTKRLKGRVTAADKPEPGEYQMEDEKFLTTCRDLIEKHLSQVDFDVEEMAACMGMSRSSLYRRIHQISDMSIKDFINEYRIHRACQMMHQGETNVTIIAEKCGFSDAKSFGRAFKQRREVTPKLYMQRKNQEDEE